MHIRLILLPFLLLTSTMVEAQSTLLDDMPQVGTGVKEGIEEEKTSPGADKLNLPAMPLAENLASFTPSAASRGRFYIDKKSLSIGKDKEIRYTLIIEGKSGAKTINYEGVRCNSQDARLYAFAKSDGTWFSVKKSTWRPIKAREQNIHHVVLMTEYFCPDGIVAADVATIEKRFK